MRRAARNALVWRPVTWLVVVLLVAGVALLVAGLARSQVPSERPAVVAGTAAPTATSPVPADAGQAVTGEPASPSVPDAMATTRPTWTTIPSPASASATDTRLPRPTSTSPEATATVRPTRSPERPEPTATPTKPPLPPCEVGCVEIGVTLENFPGPLTAISDFGDLTGRMPDIVMFFQAWGDDDRAFKPWLADLATLGVVPLITWEPWRRDEVLSQHELTLQAILDGQHDAYIDEWARRSAEHGAPIYLRFAHEMNTPPGEVFWYPWQGDPARYIAVWRYVHDRFEAAGASNVEWVWSVAWMNRDAQAYYPGDAYVDWVGLTVLNFGTTVEGSTWRSFAELYTAADDGVSQSALAASFGKRVMISEIASAEQGGDKGMWIAEMGQALRVQFPEVRALVWNNYAAARHVPEVDWRVNSSPEALAGWQKLLADLYITGPASQSRRRPPSHPVMPRAIREPGTAGDWRSLATHRRLTLHGRTT